METWRGWKPDKTNETLYSNLNAQVTDRQHNSITATFLWGTVYKHLLVIKHYSGLWYCDITQKCALTLLFPGKESDDINPLGSNVELRSTLRSLARGPMSSLARHVILLCFLSCSRSSCHLLCAVWTPWRSSWSFP